MFKGDRNFAVGLFVSVAIVAFVAFVIWLTGRTGVEEMKRYSLMFDRDVSGLAMGGPVKYMGVSIGSVVRMNLEREEGMRVRVDIDVLASTPVDSGTYASLALQGITGVAVVNLASEPGVHGPLEKRPGQEHPVIPVRDVGFAAVISSAPEIMNKLDRLLTQAGEILGEENRESVSNTLENVENLTAALAGERETIASLPTDLGRTLGDIQSTLGELQEIIAELRPQLNATATNLAASSDNMVMLTERIDRMLSESEDDVARFIEEGLGEAPALIGETRQTLRDLQKLLQELKDNPSQLIHREDMSSLDVEP
jgi:phospholipid/cholesterol/gamma-HCH transport system substrate-binding protein